MDMPTPRARISDPRTNVTYVILAYRDITAPEAQMIVRQFLARQKKAPKRGSTVIIQTILGFDQ